MKNTIRLLLIEDNCADARLVEEMLLESKIYKFTIVHAVRLTQGLKQIVSETFDAVLLDLILPDSHGLSTFFEINHHASEIPIIILTGIQDEEMAGKAVSEGAQDYLIKGALNSQQLISAVCYSIERKNSEKKMKHLNAVLHAVRNVNQLITKETNRETLIQKACNCLTSTRGYNHAWVVLIDNDGRLISSAHSNIGKTIDSFLEELSRNKFPSCWDEAVKNGMVVIIGDTNTLCKGCRLANLRLSQASLCARLAFENTIYGVLTVSIPQNVADDQEEIRLFKELVDDIGYALHKMELLESNKRAGMKLLESEAFLDSLFKQSPSSMWVSDEDGTLIKLNRACRELLNIREEEVVGKYNLLQDEVIVEQGFLPLVKAVFEKGETANFVIRYDTSKLKHLQLEKYESLVLEVTISPYRDTSGKITNAIIQHIDITRKEAAEKALQESEKLYHLLADNTLDSIWLMNLDLEFTYVNPAVKDMLGFEPDEWLGSKLPEHCAEEDFQYMSKFIHNAIGSGDNNYNIMFESCLLHKDGHKVPVEITGKVIYAEEKIIGFQGTARDITKRKQAESELQRREQFLSSLLKAIPTPVFYKDKQGRYLGCNRAFTEIMGVSSTDIIGKTVYDLWPSEHADVYHQKDIELMENPEHQVYEFEVKDKEGKKRPVIYAKDVFVDEKGEVAGLVGAFLDITEIKKAERELKEERDRAQKYLDIAGVMIVALNRDGDVSLINKKGCQILGYDEHEIIGKKWFDKFLPERYRQNVNSVYSELMRGGQVGAEYFENPILNKQGQERLIAWHNTILKDEQDNIYGTLSSGEDITERKQAVEALAAEKERLAVTLRSIADAVIATDTEGVILIFNNVAEQLTGWQEHEAIGKPLTDVFKIIDENTRESLDDPVAKVLKQNKIVDLVNSTILIAKDGTERIIADSGAPIKSKSGEVIGVVLVFRDVTKTKQMQELISRAQRLETAGRISGQIAHDFNNLLAPLVAYPEFIKERIPPDHSARQYVEKMENAASQMAEINQQLLTLSRRGHYNLEPLNLNSVINQVISQICQSSGKLNVELNLSPDLMNVKGGSSQIYRVIANIIANALDAMKQTGKLTIKSENFYADQISEKYGRVPKGEYIKLTISDTGEGIKEEFKFKIFDPFFTTKSADRKKGSGLGLSVVHTVMEDHKGYVDLQSVVGQGTSFYLYFPVTREPINDFNYADVVGGKEKILIVDDDLMQREVTSRLMEKLGYDVCAVESGELAIEHVKRNKPDLLVIDMIMLEGLDGAETYRKILELYPNQKAIIISGYADTGRVEEAINLGAGSCVRKPLTLRAIALAVRQELDKQPTILEV